LLYGGSGCSVNEKRPHLVACRSGQLWRQRRTLAEWRSRVYCGAIGSTHRFQSTADVNRHHHHQLQRGDSSSSGDDVSSTRPPAIFTCVRVRRRLSHYKLCPFALTTATATWGKGQQGFCSSAHFQIASSRVVFSSALRDDNRRTRAGHCQTSFDPRKNEPTPIKAKEK
jgi:hypothetical protein